MTGFEIPIKFNQRTLVKIITEYDDKKFNTELNKELQKLYDDDHVVLNIDIKQPELVNTGDPTYDYYTYTAVIIYAQK